MKEKLCGLLLKALQSMHWPERHLYNEDGSMYMGRWNIVGEFLLDANGKDILGTRSTASKVLEVLTRGRYRAIRLHWIRRRDSDRDRHNHPFDFDSLILGGWYLEEYEEQYIHPIDCSTVVTRDAVRMRMPGMVNNGKASTFHRIASVPESGVWTLFFMTANTNDWGFKVNGVFVKSQHYFIRRRREAKGLKG